MKAPLLLRIGAILLFLHATGHTLGGVIYYKPHSLDEAAVIASMKGYLLPPIEGSTRTLWDFYYGWGLSIGLLRYVLAAQAWILAGQATRGEPATKPHVLLLAVACFIVAYLSWRYFFFLPTALSLLCGVCFTVAWLLLRAKEPVSTHPGVT